jgi:hypothetical protein
VEEARVVAPIGAVEAGDKAGVNLVAVEQGLKLANVFGAAVFGDAEEADAVDDALAAKLSEGLSSAGLLRARLLAMPLRHSSISPRKASSQSCAPRLQIRGRRSDY